MSTFEDFDWSDLTPISIPQSTTDLCTIAYKPKYTQLTSYFRPLMSKKEYSERALFLTSEIISMNPAHYTVWHYRYEIHKVLEKSLTDELEWVDGIALEISKNYQIWNYREKLLDFKGSAEDLIKEFVLIDIMLDEDSKNYHVWSHREWVIKHLGLNTEGVLERELEFTERFIDDDVRNNSAWNHRFFSVFSKIKAIESKDDQSQQKLIDDEINFVKERIDLVPQNASSWNYLLGIYKKFGKDLSDLKLFCEKYANIEQEETDNKDDDVEDNVISSYALETLSRIYAKTDVEKSKTALDLLASKYDPIRAPYWKYQKTLLV